MQKIKWALGLLSTIFCQASVMADTACEGIRAGIQGGYGLIDFTATNTQPLALPQNTADTSSSSGRGAIGGCTIDWQTVVGHSDVMMGAEASFNFITCKGKKNGQAVALINPGGAPPGQVNDLSTTIQFKRSFDFTAKIGYLFKGAALGYIKAGPSLSHWKASSSSDVLLVGGASSAQGSSSANIVGLIIGIGAEFPLSERFSFGMEYNYRHYKEYTHNLVGTTRIGQGYNVNVSVKPDSSAIMLRLNYKLSATDFTTSAPDKEKKRKRIKRLQPEP